MIQLNSQHAAHPPTALGGFFVPLILCPEKLLAPLNSFFLLDQPAPGSLLFYLCLLPALTYFIFPVSSALRIDITLVLPCLVLFSSAQSWILSPTHEEGDQKSSTEPCVLSAGVRSTSQGIRGGSGSQEASLELKLAAPRYS